MRFREAFRRIVGAAAADGLGRSGDGDGDGDKHDTIPRAAATRCRSGTYAGTSGLLLSSEPSSNTITSVAAPARRNDVDNGCRCVCWGAAARATAAAAAGERAGDEAADGGDLGCSRRGPDGLLAAEVRPAAVRLLLAVTGTRGGRGAPGDARPTLPLDAGEPGLPMRSKMFLMWAATRGPMNRHCVMSVEAPMGAAYFLTAPMALAYAHASGLALDPASSPFMDVWYSSRASTSGRLTGLAIRLAMPWQSFTGRGVNPRSAAVDAKTAPTNAHKKNGQTHTSETHNTQQCMCRRTQHTDRQRCGKQWPQHARLWASTTGARHTQTRHRKTPSLTSNLPHTVQVDIFTAVSTLETQITTVDVPQKHQRRGWRALLPSGVRFTSI